MCEFLLTTDRLKAIVFENLDLIHERHANITGPMVDRVVAVSKSNRVQVITTSNTWRPILHRLVSADTVTIVGNCLEAAIYAQTDISVDIAHDDKLDKLHGT